jgi:hypothetical protein
MICLFLNIYGIGKTAVHLGYSSNIRYGTATQLTPIKAAVKRNVYTKDTEIT